MLGILLIYFIGKIFYTLADKYNKNRWLYAILGVVVYYVGTFIGATTVYIILELNNTTIQDILVSLISVPVGIGFSTGFYLILRNNWRNTVSNTELTVLDDHLDQI